MLRAHRFLAGIALFSFGTLGACSKADAKKAPPTDDKRFDVTVWIDPKGDVPPGDVILRTTEPHGPIAFTETSGLKIGVIGIPPEGDPTEVMEHNVGETHWNNGQAAFMVTTRCLADLQPVLKKNLLPFWIVALVVGAPCNGDYPKEIGAAAQVGIGQASKVKITFDRATRVFLRVEPIP